VHPARVAPIHAQQDLQGQIAEFLLRFSSDYAPNAVEVARYRQTARGLYAEMLSRAEALTQGA
jgi:hypothetical protein